VEDARHKLKLGKGVTFVKTHLRLLPQGNDIWEADFMPAAPVNDMARLLTDAMRRPA